MDLPFQLKFQIDLKTGCLVIPTLSLLLKMSANVTDQMKLVSSVTVPTEKYANQVYANQRDSSNPRNKERLPHPVRAHAEGYALDDTHFCQTDSLKHHRCREL